MDAGWYWNIAQNGYSYTPGKQSSVAFYPLFPMIWRWTGFGYWGIILVNISLLLSSLYVIAVEYRVKGAELLILLAVPSLIFSFVPYSESVFFLGATLLLLGFKKDMILLIILGTVISCFARSASAILILCFLFTYLICENDIRWRRVRLYVAAITMAIVSSVIVRWLQAYEVGTDFSMFEVQSQWNRHLSLPTLPITTTSQKLLVWNDLLALFIGLVCGTLILNYVYSQFKKRLLPQATDWIISLLYIAGITAVTLLFSGTYGQRGTSVHSLNRFVFATPFYTIFLIELLQRLVITKRVLITSCLLFFALYLSFVLGSVGKYATLSFQVASLGYFGLMAIVPSLYLFAIWRKNSRWAWAWVYVISLILQSCLYCAHLYGLRVG